MIISKRWVKTSLHQTLCVQLFQDSTFWRQGSQRCLDQWWPPKPFPLAVQILQGGWYSLVSTTYPALSQINFFTHSVISLCGRWLSFCTTNSTPKALAVLLTKLRHSSTKTKITCARGVSSIQTPQELLSCTLFLQWEVVKPRARSACHLLTRYTEHVSKNRAGGLK